MRHATSLALLALALAGCGDDPPLPPQSCRAFVGPALRAAPTPSHLAVVGVSPSYVAGRVREVSLDDLTVRPLPIEATGDTVLRPLGSALALLHRAVGDQDNLTLYDPRTGAACQVPLVTDAEARASRSRPYADAHDAVAVDDGRLYVTRHTMASLAVVDVASGTVSRTIDLAPYEGSAPLPHADAVAMVNGEAWVTLERDDDPTRERPTQRGLVVRIDPRTDRVTGTITLNHPNPVGPLRPSADGRARLVATVGSYNIVGDGAVESIDVATGEVTELVGEGDVMGNIDAFAVADARRLVLRVTAERHGTAAIDDLRVVLFDTETRAAATLLRMSVWGAAGPVVAGDRIYVSDPGDGPYHAGAGLRVFSREGVALRAVPVALDPGFMPYDVQPAP